MGRANFAVNRKRRAWLNSPSDRLAVNAAILRSVKTGKVVVLDPHSCNDVGSALRGNDNKYKNPIYGAQSWRWAAFPHAAGLRHVRQEIVRGFCLTRRRSGSGCAGAICTLADGLYVEVAGPRGSAGLRTVVGTAELPRPGRCSGDRRQRRVEPQGSRRE